MNKVSQLLFVIALTASVACFGSGEVKLSPNAPVDKPKNTEGKAAISRMYKLLEPYTAKAKKTYPKAKEKFSRGLPKGEHFFVVTRLRDKFGTVEQVFIAVTKISNGYIYGRIYSNIRSVKGYRHSQKYKLQEKDIVDWLITKPNGGEEGNVVGKFLDTLR